MLISVILGVLVVAALVNIRDLRRRLDEMTRRLGAAEQRADAFDDHLSRLSRGAPQRPRPDTSQGGKSPSVYPVTPDPSPTDPLPAGQPAGRLASETAAASSVPASARTAAGSVPPINPPPAGAGASGSPRQPAEPTPSLEERIGTQWAVWVGGLALALGGLLLVRYSIEQGYFGAGARIVMGLVFSAALVVAGERFRRSEQGIGLAAIPAAHIPGVLTAAGTTIAFGTIYAAHGIYGFIGPAVTFILLGAVGIATMLASALHGPALGGLGLTGSYVAPLLVTSARPSPWPLLIYLGVVSAAAMGLARLRDWIWLAAVAVCGAFVWGLPFLERIMAGATDWQLGAYAHVLVQLALAALFIAIDPHRGRPDREAVVDPVATPSLGALAALAAMVAATALLARGRGAENLTGAVPFIVAVAAILLAAAWMSAPAAGAALLAGGVVLVGVAVWPGLRQPPATSLLASEIAGVLTLPEHVQSYLIYATLASLGVTVAGALRLLRGQQLPAPITALYALAATVTPLLALVLAYLRVTQFDRSISFACAGAGLAVILASMAERFHAAEIDELPATRLATGAFAAASIAAFGFALTAFLDRGYLTVALALAAVGTAAIAVRRDIPLLRHVVTALAIVVLARIAWDPRIMGDDVGTWPIVNWLLVGYAVPAGCFWGAARLLARRTDGVPVRMADAVAVLLAGLLGFFQVHHALNDGDVLAPASGHIEQGLLALVAIGLSYALMRLDLARANPVFQMASLAFGTLSGALSLLGLGIAENPLFTGDRVLGPPLASSLLLAYLVPGLAMVLATRAARGHRPDWFVVGLAISAVLLIFGYVTLEVRHLYQGELISYDLRTGSAEGWTYSAAWLALGIVFLGYGVVRGSIEARIASAALVLLAVGKVFLIDLAGLRGIWRPLSFIVLGLVLIGIGLVYQRILFARPQRPDASSQPDATPRPDPLPEA